MYKVMGRYKGSTEEVDEANSQKEAEYLLGEYRMAFGADWELWVERV